MITCKVALGLAALLRATEYLALNVYHSSWLNYLHSHPSRVRSLEFPFYAPSNLMASENIEEKNQISLAGYPPHSPFKKLGNLESACIERDLNVFVV